MHLQQKVVVITGGTSGVGRQLVEQLYKSNQVIVLGRSEARLRALQLACPGVNTIQADLAKPMEIEAAVEKIAALNHGIDILINNAAVQYELAFTDAKFCYENIAQEIQVNFIAVCQLISLLLPSLQQQKEAVILNVNSALGLVAKKSSAVYCGTKAALNLFSSSLSYQLEHTNIKVLQAFLPLVDTPMTAGRGKNKLPAKQAAYQIICGIQQGTRCNNIGKVKLLHILLRLWPELAKKIIRNA